ILKTFHRFIDHGNDLITFIVNDTMLLKRISQGKDKSFYIRYRCFQVMRCCINKIIEIRIYFRQLTIGNFQFLESMLNFREIQKCSYKPGWLLVLVKIYLPFGSDPFLLFRLMTYYSVLRIKFTFAFR